MSYSSSSLMCRGVERFDDEEQVCCSFSTLTFTAGRSSCNYLPVCYENNLLMLNGKMKGA